MFPFLRGAGGKLRETIQNLFQTPFEDNHGRRFYNISEKEYANEPQDHKKGGWIHPDNFVRRLPRGIFGRKGRRAETAANSGQPVTRKNEVIAM